MKLRNQFIGIVLLIISSSAHGNGGICQSNFESFGWLVAHNTVQDVMGRHDQFPIGSRGIKDHAVVQDRIYQSVRKLTQFLDPATQQAYMDLFGPGGLFLNKDFPIIMADAVSDESGLSDRLKNFMGVETFADGELLRDISKVTLEKLEYVYGINSVYRSNGRPVGSTERQFFEVRKRALRYFTLAIEEDSFLRDRSELRDDYRKALLMWGVQYSVASFNPFYKKNYTPVEEYQLSHRNGDVGWLAPSIHGVSTLAGSGYSFLWFADLLGAVSVMSPEGIFAALLGGGVYVGSQFIRFAGNSDDPFDAFMPDRSGAMVSPWRLFFGRVRKRMRQRQLSKHRETLTSALESGQAQLVNGSGQKLIEADTVVHDGKVETPQIEMQVDLSKHIDAIASSGDEDDELNFIVSQFVIDGQKLISGHSLSIIQGDRDFTDTWEVLAAQKPNRTQRQKLNEIRNNPIDTVNKIQAKSVEINRLKQKIRDTRVQFLSFRDLLKEKTDGGFEPSESVMKRLESLISNAEKLLWDLGSNSEVMDLVASSLLEGRIEEALAVAQGFPQLSDRLHVQGSELTSQAPHVNVVGGISPIARVIRVKLDQIQHGEIKAESQYRKMIHGVSIDGERLSLARASNSALKELCNDLVGISKFVNIEAESFRATAKYNLLSIKDGIATVEAFSSSAEGTHKETLKLRCSTY